MTHGVSSESGRFLVKSIWPGEVFTRDEVTEEQRMFSRTAAEFMRREVLPHEARLYAHDWEFTRALLRRAAELDLLRLEIPEQYGGLALSRVSSALVAEKISVNPSFGGSLGAHAAIGTLPIVYFGTDAQKASYLPRLASAELIGAYALTEPGSGSDARAARTIATPTADGQHYLLTGQKMWITNGGFADVFTIFAKVNGDAFTAFIVERGMGVVSGPEEKKLGLEGSSTTALMLDQVKVPAGNVLGTIGEGHKVAFNILNLGRVKLGARNMSGVWQALREATRYARDRQQFGRPIIQFGLIGQKLADIAIRGFVGDAMVYRTLGAVDRALDAVDPADSAAVLRIIEGFAVECSINKVFTSEALAFATDEAIQVFGGNGFSRDYPVERFYRDARITRIYEGTNEINRLLIPTRLLKHAASLEQDDDTRPLELPGVLAGERITLGRMKSLAITALRESAATYGAGLADQQELLGRIADLTIDIYALESVVCRAEKLAAARFARADVALDTARVFSAEATTRAALVGGTVAATLHAAGGAVTLAKIVKTLAVTPASDTIAMRRRIAGAVSELIPATS